MRAEHDVWHRVCAMKAVTQAMGRHTDLEYIMESFSSHFHLLPLMQVPGPQTSMSFVKHIPSMSPSSLEPPNVLSTALFVTQQDKDSTLGKSLRSALPGPLKMFSVCSTFLPFSSECAVPPGRTQAFTDRKDRRNSSSYKICLVKFHASASSFMLELSLVWQCQGTRPWHWFLWKIRNFLAVNPFPKCHLESLSWAMLYLSLSILPWYLLRPESLVRSEGAAYEKPTDSVNCSCSCRSSLIGQFSVGKIVRRNAYSVRNIGSWMGCSCHIMEFCVSFSPLEWLDKGMGWSYTMEMLNWIKRNFFHQKFCQAMEQVAVTSSKDV